MTWSGFLARLKDPRTIAILIVVGIVVPFALIHRPEVPVSRSTENLFTDSYPAYSGFVDELKGLRRDKKLTSQNEFTIAESVKTVTASMGMPPAILWCLMFQESRLDNLLGIEGERPIYGLGQFSHFSFFEINHQLTRYTDSNLETMKSFLGRDVRPIGPIARPLTNPSSYYYIPTAVVSTGSFLQNRFLQLKHALRWQGIDPDPQLLWLYAAMAYNKGTRTVLSLWNEIQRTEGIDGVRASVVNPDTFNRVASDSALADASLRRIWPKDRAHWYSKELVLHIRQIRQCATTSPFLPDQSREVTSEE